MELALLKESNPWWEDKNWADKDFHLTNLNKQSIRWIYTIIDDFSIGIYSLRGSRQVGKTCWIKQKIKYLLAKTALSNIFFYSCDNLNKDDLLEIINVFLELSESGKKFIFLDEIPFVKDWELAIKHLYDAGKLKDCFVLLCGSNSLDLKRSVERLPGRGDAGKRHFIMQPLLFSEYLKAINFKLALTGKKAKDEALLKLNLRGLTRAYNDYLLTGGFLKIINEYYETKAISDASYDVYLKWIIGDLAKLNLKEKYAKQILRRVLETGSSEVSWSSLMSGTEVDTHNTIAKYAEALEEMFVLNILFKMDFNKKIPDYPKSKKIYFSDPFIISCAYKWVNSIEDNFRKYNTYLEQNTDKISEGVFLNHMIRILTRRNKSNVFNYSDVIYYWTNKAKTKEVDFVYDGKAFEVKYRNEIKSSDYRGLSDFKEAYLITKRTFDKRTYPIPVFLMLLQEVL
ncbi:MAG: ATP-binding protein [Nanoarchaeota archaeon]|nr:ATP-binding protein [Nanoarchaeota archaeon]